MEGVPHNAIAIKIEVNAANSNEIENIEHIMSLIEKAETKGLGKKKIITFLKKKGVSNSNIIDSYSQYYQTHGLYQITFYDRPLGFCVIKGSKGRNAIISTIDNEENIKQGMKIASRIYEINGSRVDDTNYKYILAQIASQEPPFHITFRESGAGKRQTCKMCIFENKQGATHCDMCTVARPKEEVAKDEAPKEEAPKEVASKEKKEAKKASGFGASDVLSPQQLKELHAKMAYHYPQQMKELQQEMHKEMTYHHQQYSSEDTIIKTLILGSGSVGKSTLLKSFMFALDERHQGKEMEETIARMRINIVDGMILLLDKPCGMYQLKPKDLFTTTEMMDSTDVIFKFDENMKNVKNNELKRLSESIHTLWNSEQIQKVYRDRLKQTYAFPDNMDYFFNKVKDVLSESYVVTDEDWLKLRVIDSGLRKKRYTHNKIIYDFHDVGGQRSERRTWCHAFDGVDCVIYVCALNHFCSVLREDESTNALDENIALWEQIANKRWFTESKLIVLLNKTDLFRECLMSTPLTFCFGNEYKGRNYMDLKPVNYAITKRIVMELLMKNMDVNVSEDILETIYKYSGDLSLQLVYEDGVEFIKQKFLSIKPDISIYEVSAIDTNQVKWILDDISSQFTMAQKI